MTLYIIVEGQTEEEFINNSLSHYLKNFNIDNAVPILLETSPGFFGGDISYTRYATNVNNLLQSDPNAVVTSLIDFFRLRNDFPGYIAAGAIWDKSNRVSFLEQQLSNAISNDKFIPYIQLHEFEALLFSDITGFQYILRLDETRLNRIRYVINNYPNPELINDGEDTAPSKRLKTLIPRYRKTFHGPVIALENGMTPVLAKCSRFNHWVMTVINKCNNV